MLLVIAGTMEVGAKAGAAADHLPELGLGAHHLEEDEVDHLRHVDAGIHHVHGDGDVRRLLRVREIVDQGLGVFFLVGDDSSELAGEVRVVGVEPPGDEERVVMGLGEDDGLAEPVAVVDSKAVGHQVFQDLVDGCPG